MEKKPEVKMDLHLVRHFRLAGLVLLWVGMLTKIWLLFGIGVFVWVATYLHSIEKMELKAFPPEEENDEEEDEQAE